jgi:hypothetical protein
MCWIMRSESSDDADRQFPVVEYLIIQSDKQASNIFSLSEVPIKFGVQVLEDGLTDRWRY